IIAIRALIGLTRGHATGYRRIADEVALASVQKSKGKAWLKVKFVIEIKIEGGTYRPPRYILGVVLMTIMGHFHRAESKARFRTYQYLRLERSSGQSQKAGGKDRS